VLFSGLTANGSGDITVSEIGASSYTGNGFDAPVFNGFQLVSVPEPSALAIFGLGVTACGLLMLRRRKSTVRQAG
jgi:hypothetical protein